MRKQIIATISDIFAQDDTSILLLGDIGSFAFSTLKKQYPTRVINLGICEQASISLCAGLAMEGFHPIFYTIAPFAVERCLEQIKLDIGYQNLPVSIVSVGGSYDYSSLGFSHHCPADVSLMMTIPNISILVPGCNYDVDTLLKETHGKKPVYMRLSEHSHTQKIKAQYPHCSMVKLGNKGTCIVAGDLLDNVVDACKDLDVSIYYYTTLQPYDLPIGGWGKIALIESFYEGTSTHLLSNGLMDATVLSLGVPRGVTAGYGMREDHEESYGLNTESLRKRLTNFFYGY